MRTAPADAQGAFSENAFANLSGTRLEANRIVGDCIEQLRSGEMKRLLEAASGASKLDPGNRQAWRLQMLAHLCARNYGDALAALTQTGDELWLPVTESTVLIRLDDGGSVTVFGGDRIQLGQADKVGFVRVQGICTAGTEKVKSFEGLLTMSAVQRQKVDAADWVRSLASSLQLSPAVVCAFEEIHSQAERKNKLQRLFLNPAFRPN